MTKLAVILLLAAFVAAPVSTGWAQVGRQETIVIQRPEEYQLRILESQVQMLRNKLYAQQRMDDKQKQQWLNHYNQVAKRLESWNKFAGAYNLE